MILPTCANDSLPATPHVYAVNGFVCEAVVSAWIDDTGACLELHLDPTRDVVIDSASLVGVRGPAPILVASGNVTTGVFFFFFFFFFFWLGTPRGHSWCLLKLRFSFCACIRFA